MASKAAAGRTAGTASQRGTERPVQTSEKKKPPGTKTIPPNPLITAIARCGDNDNDPFGYFETSVAAVAGGQVSWGWDINVDLYCDHASLRLMLISSGPDKGIHFIAGGYDLIDDQTTWSEITECWLQVSVADATKYGVQLGVDSYNSTPSIAVATKGRSIAPNQCPHEQKGDDRGPYHPKGDTQQVFSGQSFLDLDISAWVSMVGCSPISRNGVVAKILLYGTSLQVKGAAESPYAQEPIPANCRDDWRRRYKHRRFCEKR